MNSSHKFNFIDQQAFTLIEVLISMALSCIMLSLILGLFVQMSRHSQFIHGQAQVDSELHAASLLLTRALRSRDYGGCRALSTTGYLINAKLAAVPIGTAILSADDDQAGLPSNIVSRVIKGSDIIQASQLQAPWLTLSKDMHAHQFIEITQTAKQNFSGQWVIGNCLQAEIFTIKKSQCAKNICLLTLNNPLTHLYTSTALIGKLTTQYWFVGKSRYRDHLKQTYPALYSLTRGKSVQEHVPGLPMLKATILDKQIHIMLLAQSIGASMERKGKKQVTVASKKITLPAHYYVRKLSVVL